MYYRSWVKGSSGKRAGSWVNVKNRYLGLKFMIHGEPHFGRARLRATCSSKSKVPGVLTGYAYETVPSKPIVAGRTKGPEDGDVGQPDAAVLAAPPPNRPAWVCSHKARQGL
jgi:hypothetical protein